MENVGVCKVCGTLTNRKCEKCKLVFYCTQQHETGDFINHQEECNPYKLCFDKARRAYMIANRSIETGAVILEELPLIRSPANADSVCFCCLNILERGRGYRCRRCKWLICSHSCQNKPEHFPECYYLSRKRDENMIRRIPNTRLSIFNLCVQIVRCLYQKEFFPSVWEKIIKLESHLDARKSLKSYSNIKKKILDILHDYFGIKGEYTEDEIMQIWAIYKTNQQLIPVLYPYPSAIYELSPMFRHNCTANCSKAIDSQGMLRITAAVPIKKGERLTLCYVYPFWTTHKRRIDLKKNRFMKCLCSRCKDVTESRMFLSSIKCPETMCTGIVLPITFLLKVPVWKCSVCSYKISRQAIFYVFKNFDQLIDNTRKLRSCNASKVLLYKIKLFLPENSSYTIQAKLLLILTIGNVASDTPMRELSNDDLIIMTFSCLSLINIINTLAPAEKSLRGFILYKYQHCLEEVIKRKVQTGYDLDDEDEVYKVYQYIFKEIMECLKYESSITIEGKVFTETQKRLQNLEEMLSLFE